MKVVLLAGGLGTRMREETEFRPKPMVEIGGKPAIWHIMKTYATQGFDEFIICAGYKGEQIKNYFYNYGVNNLDFSLRLGDKEHAVFYGSHDEFSWKVTVVDTGQNSLTAERINRIRPYVEGERFLCTYGDGIANVNIQSLLETHELANKIATVTSTHPQSRFGVLEVNEENLVISFREKPISNEKISIGYFVFEPTIFDYLDDGPLEDKPLQSLTANHELASFLHTGFWHPMDTQKELENLNQIWESGEIPWKIWK